MKLFNKDKIKQKLTLRSINKYDRDLVRNEIEIIDGHDDTSYYWIMPTKIINYSDTCNIDNFEEMNSAEISIEEFDVDDYLLPFLERHFDKNLLANKQRMDYCGDYKSGHVEDFGLFLTPNYYTFESIRNMLKDINDTIEILLKQKENEYTIELKLHNKREVELVIDFYRRFITKVENMMIVGNKNGYDLIAITHP